MKSFLSKIFLFSWAMSLCVLAESAPASLALVTQERITELESLHQKASDFLIKNDFEHAIQVYSDIILMEPDDETAYTGLGQIYMVLGQFKRANDAFKNALHINPDNQVALQGIQAMMDPDGVEGMINPTQAELETPPAAEASITTSSMPDIQPVAIPEPASAPWMKPEQRLAAFRAKKSIRSVTALPHKPVGSFGRLGLLHAQRIQMALKNAGTYHGPINGMFGEATRKALLDFQNAAGLPSSGHLTTETWTQLSNRLTS